MDIQHLALGAVSFDAIRDDPDHVRRAAIALHAALRSEAAFSTAAIAQGLPLGYRHGFAILSRVDDPTRTVDAIAVAATPEIFGTLGIPIVRGRAFDDRDPVAIPPPDTDNANVTAKGTPATVSMEPAIVLSEKTARDLFGTVDVAGGVVHCVLVDAAPATCHVTGVARDTDTFVEMDRRWGSAYTPLSMDVVGSSGSQVAIVGRTSGDPATAVPLFERLVHRVDPTLAVASAATGERLMGAAYIALRGLAALAVALAMLATGLAMTGLYGVLSHIVSRRTREIGIRVALGAEIAHVRTLVVREGLQPVLWGLAAGLLAGTGVRFVIRAVENLPSMTVVDPIAIAVAAVTLVAAGTAASYLPARRASNVDPNVALRHL
jgi:putative ABC transport system permease protein